MRRANAAEVALTFEDLPDSAAVRNPAPRNSPTQFTTADAPPAAANRALRRAWAARANAVLRHTGNPDAARQAAVKVLVAALDCDDIAYRAIRRTNGDGPINLDIAAKRREVNLDGAADRIADIILAGGRP